MAFLTLLMAAVIVVVVIRLCKGLIASLEPVLLRQLELVDKSTTLAASHDVMAYQGIQVMSQPVVGYDGDAYDPSDAAEARREAERSGLDPEGIDDGNREALDALFG